MKNASRGLISGLDSGQERITVLEDISIKTTKIKKQREQLRQVEQNTQELWKNHKRYNICIKGTPGGEERQKNGRNT